MDSSLIEEAWETADFGLAAFEKTDKITIA